MHPTPPHATLDQARHAAQLAFEASGSDLVVGSLAGTPFTLAELQALQPDDPRVRQVFDGGLTAEVWRLEAGGQAWALKRRRAQARVHNLDGQTSFLNEVQRRADFQALKAQDPARWQPVADTRFAAYRAGLMLSPWIEGAPISGWDERRYGQLLRLATQLWLEGLFEWDYSPGNVLDDGRQLRLFDFGYCYRFDPLRQFNTAGTGLDNPRFHPAERIETRAVCAWLLEREHADGPAAALAAFRVFKAQAAEVYADLLAQSRARGAGSAVLEWLAGIAAGWRQALVGDIGALYLAENWRSHALDLDDDLRGRSCTATTLRRADWLLATLREHAGALRAHNALFHGDEALDTPALLQRYAQRRAEALRWQLPGAGGEAGAAAPGA